jgi:hypothetical protein
MGDYLPPGSCDKEVAAARQAQKDMNKAYNGYRSAKHNMQAGGLSTGAAGLTALGCTLMTAGLGAIICFGGAGLATMGGIKWTESAGEGLINAEDDMDKALGGAEDALDKLCKCIEQHMVCGAD